jgi:hypothetical protein
MATGKETETFGDFFEDYAKFFGLLMLAFVIILLFSTPTMILARRVTMIGTELSHATEDELPVRTKLDLGNAEHMQAFPKQIGGWTAFDYDATKLTEQLGADVMLMRAYSHPECYQPVFFLIMQSHNRSSFHPPIVCYPALGYTIEDEGRETLTVPNASWVEDPWLSTPDMRRSEEAILPVKKLMVAKSSPDTGKITERRVVLYFYVKEPPFSSDTITMVRVDTLVPADESYDGVLNISREFMSKTIPCMFEVQRPKQRLFSSLVTGSIADKLLLFMLFLTPFAVIFYPELRTLLDRTRS